jgi:hypothetical protein
MPWVEAVAVSYESDDPFPGIIAVVLTDAEGHESRSGGSEASDRAVDLSPSCHWMAIRLYDRIERDH